MTNHPIREIAGQPLFAQLPTWTQEELARDASARRYRPQGVIVHQGDVWPCLFMVTAGEVCAVKESAEGRVFIATSLKAGDVFWGAAFFIADAPMPVMLQAKSDTSILVWSRDKLAPIIQAHGMMSWRLCQLGIARMLQAGEIVEDLAFQPVMGRLAGLLLEVFGDAGDGFRARELTLDDMAARIGSTREIVCRYLYRLAESGAIEIRRTELRIVDRQGLEKQMRGQEK